MPAFLALLLIASDPVPTPTVPFASVKYGIKVDLPNGWTLAGREEDETIFAAGILRAASIRPAGSVVCELGLAPESLDEYRTRIDANARRAGNRGGTLVRNEVVMAKDGDRLETLREYRAAVGGLWRERTVRLVSNRQLYTFTLNADEAAFPASSAAFDAILASVKFHKPDTGADPAGPNRWVQREFKFALDLPEGWTPVLAPSEVALFYANGPAHGIWTDNALVVARPHRPRDLKALEASFPDDLRRAEPGCEVLSCRVVPQGKGEALETVVRTRQGPFSMTVLERRFRGERFDYEVKYTVESKRFDPLAPTLQKSLDSFREVPGEVPRGGPGRPA